MKKRGSVASLSFIFFLTHPPEVIVDYIQKKKAVFQFMIFMHFYISGYLVHVFGRSIEYDAVLSFGAGTRSLKLLRH